MKELTIEKGVLILGKCQLGRDDAKLIFQILMDNRADINAIMRNSKGQLMTPLDAAVYRGNRGCAKYIQLHGGISASKLMDKTALKKALAMYVSTVSYTL